MSPAFIILLISALIFDFLNGFHDSSNIVATPIASRAVPPRLTLWTVAIAHFVGPFLFGVAVAETIGTEITDPDNVTMPVVIAAVQAAIVWNIITWYFGIPSSSSHALIGGLVGAVIVSAGIQVINSDGSTGQYSMGRTLDISENGLKLETTQPLVLGDKLIVTVGLEEDLVDLKGEVTHTRPESGRYLNGIEFTEISEEVFQIHSALGAVLLLF